MVASGSTEIHTPKDLTLYFGHLKFLSGNIIWSLPVLDPIQRASVFLSLSLRPETAPNLSSILREASKELLDPSNISVVSSAYWLILISFTRTTVYRKPTHTDRLLDESSYNPTSHKATTIKTLTRRARLVSNTPDSLSDENKYLRRVFDKNNYKDDFIRRNTHRPTETNANSTPTTTATIPYIKGTSETIARILQPYNIRVAHRPITTLRHLRTNVKDKDNLTTGKERFTRSTAPTAKPPTSERLAGTSRQDWLNTNERQEIVMSTIDNNHIAEHHRLTNHTIDWDSAQCVTYSTNYFQRLTLESWFTNLEQTPLNRCQQLPAPYKRLIHDINRTNEPNRTT